MGELWLQEETGWRKLNRVHEAWWHTKRPIRCSAHQSIAALAFVSSSNHHPNPFVAGALLIFATNVRIMNVISFNLTPLWDFRESRLQTVSVLGIKTRLTVNVCVVVSFHVTKVFNLCSLCWKLTKWLHLRSLQRTVCVKSRRLLYVLLFKRSRVRQISKWSPAHQHRGCCSC